MHSYTYSFISTYVIYIIIACQELNKENENEKTNKEYRDGTVIVHECCADYMAKYRYRLFYRFVAFCYICSFSLFVWLFFFMPY
jgi:hypothetical protein